MIYNIVITGHAEELLNHLIEYLLSEFQSRRAAIHLLNSVESAYDRLSSAPLQFPLCEDEHLRNHGYRKVRFPGTNYIMIYQFIEPNVYIMGFFHETEDYISKL